MKERTLAFLNALRTEGLPVPTSASIDALAAVAIAGIARESLREALAASVVKDEADRPTFDSLFERHFPLQPQAGRKRHQPHAIGAGLGGHGEERSERGQRRAHPERHEPSPIQYRAPRPSPQALRQAVHLPRLARNRTLERTPFYEMSPADFDDCDRLIAALAERFHAHLRRRQRAGRSRHLDIRRTIRRSVSNGGVPILPVFRERRPGHPDLVALCDCSYSVATASRFLFSLLAPARAFFRHTHLFGFVDAPVPVTIEPGRMIPAEQLDQHARSDFGRTLRLFCERHERLLTRNALVLILGDARNNRFPPRADLLEQVYRRSRQVFWLNPEPLARWNTGDSVMRVYAPHCTQVLTAGCIRTLDAALRRVLRGV